MMALLMTADDGDDGDDDDADGDEDSGVDDWIQEVAMITLPRGTDSVHRNQIYTAIYILVCIIVCIYIYIYILHVFVFLLFLGEAALRRRILDKKANLLLVSEVPYRP